MTSTRAFTVASLAEQWECSEGVIRKLVADGRLASFRIGTLIRIPAAEVTRFECQNTASNDSAADMPSSITMERESDTGSSYEPRTALGLKRRLGRDGGAAETVRRGPWAGS